VSSSLISGLSGRFLETSLWAGPLEKKSTAREERSEGSSITYWCSWELGVRGKKQRREGKGRAKAASIE